jgi:hypothetical protein
MPDQELTMTDWLIWNQLVLFAVEEEDSAFSMSFFSFLAYAFIQSRSSESSII